MLNDRVILPTRWRARPKPTEPGVVLPPEAESCVFSSLEDARSDSAQFSLSALSETDVYGTTIKPL